LNFCKNTFSWGDYIQYVWDSWLNEKNLFVVEKGYCVGICNAFFNSNYVWIEGIRVNPNFRLQGFGSHLVKHVELFAKLKKNLFSMMLIASNNSSSLLMAKKLGYKIFQTWHFYSLVPQKKDSKMVQTGYVLKNKKNIFYVKSWRWLNLDKNTINSLLNQGKIVYSKKKGKTSCAILTDSDHFKKTLIVTIFPGSTNNTLNLVKYIQNIGSMGRYEKIQILTKEQLPNYSKLEYKIEFKLMKKLFN
jgi:GNAT superfamily N-acetyltransferase